MDDRTPSMNRADAEQDLRATTDSIRADARRLEAVEEQKDHLRPGDPETDRLSSEAVELAERITRETKAERQIARDIV